MKAVHFARNNMRLGHDDGRHIRTGRTLKVAPERIEPFVWGLHASQRPLDALKYARGAMICLVSLGGEIIPYKDVYCASERRVLSYFNGERLLREFARRQALINVKLIKPFTEKYDLIVRFLETGDAGTRAAAWSAAMEATRRAERVAMGTAIWTAHAAARAAAWAAENAVAQVVAYAAAIAATDAAGAASDEVANLMLTSMITEKQGGT